jgi:hypothetical protein
MIRQGMFGNSIAASAGVGPGGDPVVTSYDNPGGKDVRTFASWAPDGGTFSNLVDGATSDDTGASMFGNPIPGMGFLFDFGVGANKMITAFKWNQHNTVTLGTWYFAGSDDAKNFIRLGNDFALGGASGPVEFTEPSANTTGYRYYGLIHISGAFGGGSPWMREVEFKIDDEGGTPDYGNAGGTGDRTASITVSAITQSVITVTTDMSVDGGLIGNLVDGGIVNDATESMFGAAAVDDYIRFDFGAGASKIIDEFKWNQHDTTTLGTWRFEGSDDASSWTQLGGTFTLGGSAGDNTYTEPSANTTGYRYYQLYHVSGAYSGSSPWMREVKFKIADA